MSLPRSPLAPGEAAVLPPVAGVTVATACTGTKYVGRADLLQLTFAPGTLGAGSFTQNQVVGAPVSWTRAACEAPGAAPRALLVNAGNANVANGAAGQACVEAVAEALSQDLGCAPHQVWQASTGVIGERLDPEPLITAARRAGASTLNAAAEACLTTDTFAKTASQIVQLSTGPCTIAGFAKGSGMVQPNMATMLAFVLTDAQVDQRALEGWHQAAVATTLNAITVDGDTSTSDMALTFATGQGPRLEGPADEAAFAAGLRHVYEALAKLVVRDGEGASKFIQIQVWGAASVGGARQLAFAVANSPLVKTALAGEDANWGRILMALGKAGVAFDPLAIALSMGSVPIVRDGARVPGYDEAPVAAHLKGQEIEMEISVGDGPGAFCVWTCDLTHGYIAINADYRS